MPTTDQQKSQIERAREQLIELGEKYHGRDIPTEELFQFMDIEGFLDLDMRRNLKYVSIGNGNLTEEELSDLEQEGGINSVNLFVDKFGMTPICRAMRQEDNAMIDRILSHPDFDPNVRNLNDDHPATPLMIAAEHKPQYLERLLAHPDTDADLMDKFGYCALAIVLQYHPEYLPVMLASKKVSLNKNNCNNGSLLSFVVQKADTHCLELLFQHGASTEGFDNSAAPILICLVRERFDVLPILTKYGCKIHVDDLRDQIAQGAIDLDKVGPHIIVSNVFTAAELLNEFDWTG